MLAIVLQFIQDIQKSVTGRTAFRLRSNILMQLRRLVNASVDFDAAVVFEDKRVVLFFK